MGISEVCTLFSILLAVGTVLAIIFWIATIIWIKRCKPDRGKHLILSLLQITDTESSKQMNKLIAFKRRTEKLLLIGIVIFILSLSGAVVIYLRMPSIPLCIITLLVGSFGLMCYLLTVWRVSIWFLKRLQQINAHGAIELVKDVQRCNT